MKKTTTKKINVQQLKRDALKNIPPEIRRIMVDTSKSPVKKSSSEILMETRYGN